MTDISKCKGGWDLCRDCYRYTAPAEPEYQSYIDGKVVKGKCADFWDNRIRKDYRALYVKYPWLNTDDNGTPFPMFGFECGEGWYNLIDSAFEAIDKIITSQNIKDFFIAQVKEKWGTLRIYTYGGIDIIDEIVSRAEDKSAKICEDCGKPGKIHEVRGWLRCQCKRCLKKWKEGVK